MNLMRLSVKLTTGFADPQEDETVLFGDLSRATDHRVPHISLVFREMWDTRTFMFLAGWAENEPVERPPVDPWHENKKHTDLVSSQKGARAVLSRAAYRKFGASRA
jgi:hypothetical protein